MSDVLPGLPRELTYRLTYADWVQWGLARRDAVFTTAPRAPLATALGWIWYFAIVTGCAAGAAYGAELAVGDGLQVPAFILTVVMISGVLAAQETGRSRAEAINDRAQFEASIFDGSDIRLTLDESAATIDRTGILCRIAWSSVVAIRRDRSIFVIAGDRGLGGIVVPVRAVPDPAAFASALRERVEQAGGTAGLRRDAPVARDPVSPVRNPDAAGGGAMTTLTSQPYRVAPAERRRVSRALGRGLRPLVLNAVVLLSAFGLILWADFAMLDRVIAGLEERFGEVSPLLVGGAAALTFLVPWLIVYAIWRWVWFRIVRRRVAERTPETNDLVATIDGSGIRVDEVGLASSWLAWSAVGRLMLVGETLVVARGAFGLMVPLAAIGGRGALAALTSRLSPAAMAASDRSIRDAVA